MNLSDVSIIKLLPPNLAQDKNVRMMCEAFDEELRRIIADIPGIAIIPNLVRKQITDNLLLDLLAWQFHCDFYSTDLPLEKKQEIILKSLDWHTRKGTPSVIEEIVSTVFSKAIVQEWFEYGGLPYRFRIGTEEDFPDDKTIAEFYRAIDSVKNTRSWLDKLTSFIYFEEVLENTEKTTTKIKEPLADYMAYKFRNGQYRRNGQIDRSYTGVKDIISVNIAYPQTERLYGTATRNGLLRRNGTIRRTGFVNDLHTEMFKTEMEFILLENAELSESITINVAEDKAVDTVGQEFKRNGKYRRNGEQLRRPNNINEVVNFKSSETVVEKLQGRAVRNGMYLRNGTIRRGLLDTSITEKQDVKANTVMSDSMISSDFFSDLLFVSQIEEKFQSGVKRDGTFYRNGKITRGAITEINTAFDSKMSGLTDTVECNESFFIGYKRPRYRNGQYLRNGTIRRDSNVLIPLEG